MFILDEKKDRICTWQRGVLFWAGQENRECCVLTSDVETYGIILSLTICKPGAGAGRSRVFLAPWSRNRSRLKKTGAGAGAGAVHITRLQTL